MTFLINRDNIEPMFGGITFVMVIFFCLCRAVITLQRIWTGKFTICNSTIHSMYCFMVVGVKFLIIFSDAIVISFAFLTLGITFFSSFTLFCLIMMMLSFAMYFFAFLSFRIFFRFFQKTNFTIIPMSIVVIYTFVKFRDWFCFFTSSANFGYDLVRHFCFSIKQRCLGPVASRELVTGFFIIYLPEKNKREFGAKIGRIEK